MKRIPLPPREDGRSSPERRRRLRHFAMFLIERNEPITGTRQGFGTGARKPKGRPNRYNTQIREAIHSAYQALNDGEAFDEVVRKLIALGLLQPDIIAEAARKLPRGPGKHGIAIRKVRPIKDYEEPTIEEISKHTGLSPYIIESARNSGTGWYDQLRDQTIQARLSPGEREVVDAIRTLQIRHAYQQAKSASQRKRLRKRLKQ